MDKWIQKLSAPYRESKHIEFKESFDVDSTREWCEIIKDIIAMANSGGGLIIFGIKDNGYLVRYNSSKLEKLDPADITNKVQKYTGVEFSNFEIIEIPIRRKTRIGLSISNTRIPLVFSKEGHYIDPVNGKDKLSFRKGSVYFRHGAKSAPGNTNDLRMVVDREVKRIRGDWLGNIRKLVNISPNEPVSILPLREMSKGTYNKVSSGRGAKAFIPIHGDDKWPYRQVEIIKVFNQNTDLHGSNRINQYDILCVKKIYNIEKKYPQFMYKPFVKSVAQYSDAFIGWLIKQWKRDKDFFKKARKEYNKKHRPIAPVKKLWTRK